LDRRCKFSPSPQQLAAFECASLGPLVLFYEFSGTDCTAALGQLAREHGGELRWTAAEEEILCGRIEHFQRAASLHFPARRAARSFVDSPRHASVLAGCRSVQVAALSAQPRAVALLSAVLAKVLPRWPFDNTVEPGEEPGVDVSTVMPTSKAIAAVRAHPEQTAPVAMKSIIRHAFTQLGITPSHDFQTA